MTQFSDAFSQGTQVGQQRAALGLQALSLAGQMERQQAEAQMQAERQRAAMAALDERVKQKRVDGELLGHVMNRNFGAITPNLLMDASEEMRNVALRDNDLRELRSKWKPMYDQYMASGTLDRATPEALQAFRRFQLPIVGVSDVDDRIKDLHAQAGAGAFNDLATRLGAQGVQLGREESAMMDRYIGMFAGQEDETFQAGLQDILQQTEAMAMQRKQMQDREALARGQMSQVDFLARYGTNAQAANAVQERDAAKDRLEQLAAKREADIQGLMRRGVPREQAVELVSMSPGMQTTALKIDEDKAAAAKEAGVAGQKAKTEAVSKALASDMEAIDAQIESLNTQLAGQKTIHADAEDYYGDKRKAIEAKLEAYSPLVSQLNALAVKKQIVQKTQPALEQVLNSGALESQDKKAALDALQKAQAVFSEREGRQITLRETRKMLRKYSM